MAEPIYETPRARLLREEHRIETMKRLLREQSALGALLGTLFALVPTMLTLILATWLNPTFSTALSVLPGFVVGATVKYCARPFDLIYRVPPALVTAFVVVLFYLMSNAHPFTYLLVVVNGAAVIVTSKRRLNSLEEKALYAYRLGRIEL